MAGPVAKHLFARRRPGASQRWSRSRCAFRDAELETVNRRLPLRHPAADPAIHPSAKRQANAATHPSAKRPPDACCTAASAAHLRLPPLPIDQCLEQARRRAPGGGQLGDPGRHHWGGCPPPPRLRLVRGLRHPVQRGRRGNGAGACELRLCGRIRHRALPNPAPPADRSWQRPAPAHVGHGGLSAVRAVRRGQDRVGMARGLRRHLGPAIERPASGRLDECGRSRL